MDYRVVLDELSEVEKHYEICLVVYNESNEAISWASIKNRLESNIYSDLVNTNTIAAIAAKQPVLAIVQNDKGGYLKEYNLCPICGGAIDYDIVDPTGDGIEKDFGKTALVCSIPRGCGYISVREDLHNLVELDT